MSLDGTLYCYRNPLAFDPSTGEKIRNPWYDTTCCPPNLERTFASLPGYFYSTSSDGIYLHLYDNSELNWHLENGVGLKVTQKTNYPWDGMMEITVTPAEPSSFTFYLRVPGWADDAQVAVNGKAVPGAKPGTYLPISRAVVTGRRHSPANGDAGASAASEPSGGRRRGARCGAARSAGLLHGRTRSARRSGDERSGGGSGAEAASTISK